MEHYSEIRAIEPSTRLSACARFRCRIALILLAFACLVSACDDSPKNAGTEVAKEPSGQPLPPPIMPLGKSNGADVTDATPVRFPPPQPDRIAEIAGFLPEVPGSLGRPISDREFWSHARGVPGADVVLAKAGAFADLPVPELTREDYDKFRSEGKREPYQVPYSERTERLGTLVLAECLENQGTYLPAIDALLAAVLAEPSWVVPAHTHTDPIDLGAAMRAWTVALSAEWLGDRLSEERRAQILTALRTRIFDPYLERVAAGVPGKLRWMTSNDNWNAVCHAGVAGAALSALPDRSERAEILAAVEQYLPHFLEGYGGDGYLDEGISYFNYGMGHYAILAQAVFLQTNGRLNWFANPEIGLALQYGKGLEISGGVFPAFGDATIGERPHPWILALLRSQRGEPATLPEVPWPIRHGNLGGTLYLTAGLLDLASKVPPADVAQTTSLPIRTFFPTGGALIVRPASAQAPALAAALKGSHNGENHNQNDEGTFVVTIDGRVVLPDLGSAFYNKDNFGKNRYRNPVNTSWAHNVPLVAGRTQRTGESARVETMETRFSDDEDVWVIDLTSLYDVPDLVRLIRTFRYTRAGGGELEILDEVEFQTPQDFGAAVIAPAQWKREDGTGWRVDWNGKSVGVEVSSPDGEALVLEERPVQGGLRAKLSPARLGYRLAEPTLHGRIRTLIRPIADPDATGNQ